MTAETTTFSKCIRNAEAARNTFASPGSLKLFRQITGHSDWNEMILVYEKWLKKRCICVIIVAALYFFPVAIKALPK